MIKVIKFYILLFSHLCYATNSTNFLWQSLVNIPDNVIAKIFIPDQINLNDNGIEKHCRDDLNLSIHALTHERRVWAFKLFNSWASTLPHGLFIGTLTDYGDYDQCMSIESEIIWPQYCIVDIQFPMPQPMPLQHNLYHPTPNLLPSTNYSEYNDNIYEYFQSVSSYFYYSYIRKGICLPDSCSINDIRLLTKKGFGREFGLKLNKIFCTQKPRESWTPNYTQMIAIFTFVNIGLITFLAAIYDWFYRKKSNSLMENALLSFSPINNVRKLLFANGQEDNLSCIHGIRFLSICMVIVGHTLALNHSNSFRQIFVRKEFMTTLWLHPFLKGFYSVDTFFYLSGFLSSYIIIKLTDGDYRRFSTIGYLIFRYIRLAPQLIIYLLLITLIPSMFDGPIWHALTERISGQCKKTWWLHLLFIQNIIDPNNLCGIHIWYLAADMQLYWLSLIPTIILLRNQRIGMIVIKLLIILSIFNVATKIYMNNLPPGYVPTSENDFINEDGSLRTFLWINFQPWSHANVYLIGYFVGFYCTKNNLKNLKQIWLKSQNVFWPLIIFGYLFCIYSLTPWLYGRPFDPIWSAILWPLNRTIWALV